MKQLRVWCGPMCAAKTTGALDAARRYARHGKKVILVRPGNSRRSHEDDPIRLSTQNGEKFPCFDHEYAEELRHYIGRADVVWIDEPNHFVDEEELIDLVPKLRESSIVLVSGLGATSELEPFGIAMGFLLSTADDVIWRRADCDVCRSHATATRSLYIGETPKGGQRRVGGADSYRPVCPDCWTALSQFEPTERRTKLLA